jgi:hypothetical protein
MEDGYPNDDELKKISTWKHEDDFEKLMQYVLSLWWHAGMCTVSGGEYTLITGGWSGNEDIISAMQKNYMFWAMWWKSSNRGGRHVFSPVWRAFETNTH